MTQGQIAQLQDLSKCYMHPYDTAFVQCWSCSTFPWKLYTHMGNIEKLTLRRITHQYRHQIAAVKRNQT